MTKILTKFEAAGWIRPATIGPDRRSRAVAVTQAGRAHLLSVQKGLFPEFVAFLKDRESAERRGVKGSLARLGRFLDETR